MKPAQPEAGKAATPGKTPGTRWACGSVSPSGSLKLGTSAPSGAYEIEPLTTTGPPTDRMRECIRRFAVLLLVLGPYASGWAGETEDRLPAVWKTRELAFNYLGFTSRYSCEGLRDKVEQALLMLGARRDLVVTPYPCTRVDRPEFAPSLQIKLSTLEPAPTTAAQGIVEAHWKTVSLGGPGKLSPGDCELADQIRSEILPLFTMRNLKARIDCVPNQEPTGNIVLIVDVLVPVKD